MSDVATIRMAMELAKGKAKETLRDRLRDREIRNALRKYSNPKAPLFFFGKLEKKSDGSFWVNEAVSRVRTHPESKPLSNKSRSLGTIVNTWVVGRGSTENGGGTKLFIDNEQESPGQIIPWDYVEESKSTGKNAIEFFFGSPVPKGEIKCSEVPLIGGKEKHGHVIIYWLGCFLKGFTSVGDGQIQYSSVEIFSGDFQSVAKINQATLMSYDTKSFLVLVPSQNNEYEDRGEHSVLAYRNGNESWETPRPVSNGENGEEAEADPVLLDNGDAPVNLVPQEEEIGPSGGEEMAKKIKGAVTEPNVTTQGAIIKEEEFLRKLIRVAEECGYEYDARDLVRFHTSVKIGGFTVLGGAPGCGKSSLVALYARALLGKNKLEEDDSYLTIDVSPSWMEPEDVLGHWGLQGKYVCSQTGLVKFLRKAADSENGFPTMPIVCLEEMNLARVEHYFADFMQQLCRSEDERGLRGVPKDDSQNEPLKAFLPLSPSLRFVGTNNFDQTTQRFSPRFYDRSNYIELVDARKSEPFSKDVPSFKADFGSQVNRKTYESWFNKTPSHSILKPVVVDKYNSLTEVFKNVNLPVSRRVEVAILVYIANRPFLSECSDDPSNMDACQMRALDEVIAQKILSRYTVNSYGGDMEGEERLEKALSDLPLSRDLVKSRCMGRERPSRL